MKNKPFLRRISNSVLAAVICCALMACTAQTTLTEKPTNNDSNFSPLPVLDYYQRLSRMTITELSRERASLPVHPQTPSMQVRTAMLLGYPGAFSDLGRALLILENVLKSPNPEAISLQGVARMLSDNYLERQRLGLSNERQEQLNKENQHKVNELQDKLEKLVEIERKLPTRTLPVRPDSKGPNK